MPEGVNFGGCNMAVFEQDEWDVELLDELLLKAEQETAARKTSAAAGRGIQTGQPRAGYRDGQPQSILGKTSQIQLQGLGPHSVTVAAGPPVNPELKCCHRGDTTLGRIKMACRGPGSPAHHLRIL